MAAMGVRVPPSPPLARASNASVAEQRGMRLQPATPRCDSGRTLHDSGSAHLEVRSPLHSDRGEFDSLGPDDNLPIRCSWLDMLPWYGREEGSTPSVGSTARPRARMQPGSPKPGEAVRFRRVALRVRALPSPMWSSG